MMCIELIDYERVSNLQYIWTGEKDRVALCES
jgi:hypothetical protein